MNGVSVLSVLAIVAGAISLAPKKQTPTSSQPDSTATSSTTASPNPEIPAAPTQMRLYRQKTLEQIKATLLANNAAVVAGEQGSGKSLLAQTVAEQLRNDGFIVALIEPATPKQMLLEIAQQLEIDTHNIEGKALTAEQLKRAIASYFDSNTAFLIIDDAQLCESKFRLWLKQLRRQGIPMMLFATDPPRTDVFMSLPPIVLHPLPEKPIREIMEQAALERGLELKNSDFARLQERAGGNPMLAQRVIDEEYLGLEIEEGDHHRYLDITPLILLAGIAFVVIRFIGLGTGDQALYIFGGIAAAIFLGVSRMLYNLPPESKKIGR
ncbi:ATP-binding protein [Iningainema tapete]|uniref:ATP-binding protein n=1 Tax=Iningainema tapete TaxID=2806730 RepID=UPI0030D74AD7